MDNKKIFYILILIFLIIVPVNANSNNGMVSQDTQNSDTSDFVYHAPTDDICSEIHKMALSQEFQDYLQKNGINTDDHELNLVSSSSDAHPQVVIHTPNQELHYSITNITDTSITTNNNQPILRAAWNKFKVANRCGFTLGKVYVAYFETVGYGDAALPIKGVIV